MLVPGINAGIGFGVEFTMTTVGALGTFEVGFSFDVPTFRVIPVDGVFNLPHTNFVLLP
jgi:hypothetical protein